MRVKLVALAGLWSFALFVFGVILSYHPGREWLGFAIGVPAYVATLWCAYWVGWNKGSG